MSWNQLPQHVRDTAHKHLTQRQHQILQDRINGHSWNTIADAYNLNPATARGHYRAAVRKLHQHLKDAA